MRYLPSPGTIVDFFPTLTGFGLAGGSLYLFIRMALLVRTEPAIHAREYFSIYSKPKRTPQTARHSPFSSNVDHAPVGSLHSTTSNVLLTDFELVDAKTDFAILRTQHGRLLRVARGSFLTGVGRVLSIRDIRGRWIVQTTRGIIIKN